MRHTALLVRRTALLSLSSSAFSYADARKKSTLVLMYAVICTNKWNDLTILSHVLGMYLSIVLFKLIRCGQL